MAKQIKVIKCPNCGSSQKTELKADHYRCDNCQTDYFLDNDDINININHQSHISKKNPFRENNMIKIIAALILIIIVVAVILSLFRRPTPPTTTIKQTPYNATSNTIKTVPAQRANQYQISYEYCATQIKEDKVYILALEEHSFSYNDRHFVFTIYDLLANKKIKELPISNISKTKSAQIKWSYLDFSADKSYFIVNNSEVYLLNKNNYSFNNITSSLLNNHPDYQTGIASITIAKTTSGDAFHILTNDGKKIYYYPLIDEVYVDDYDFQMAKNRPERPVDDTSEHQMISFANRYDQDYKLIKYRFISPDGKNHIEPRSANIGDYKLDGAQGRHTDINSAYDLLNNSNFDIQVTFRQNLTPGRLYFNPSVIYFNDDILIIKTKVNAAPDAGYNYQQINIHDGSVMWTLADEAFTINEISPYHNNFIAKQDCSNYAIISENGQLIKKIKLNQE